jgi:uncharacterized protein (TIGR03492 family)
MTSPSLHLLCLSNGHGEDIIAVRILQAFQALPNPPKIEVLPLVGEGHAYTQAGFSRIGAVQAMPSGGFIYMDGRQLARDIRGGLIQLTIAQWRSIGRWAKSTDDRTSPAVQRVILAVGDLVPLLFAWQTGLPFAFVGTAKSEYYLRDESGWLQRSSWWDDRFAQMTGCIYYPWERWLLRRRTCLAVFPRDRFTAEILSRFYIPAVDLGNPMMDGLEAAEPVEPSSDLTIALIPGSRAPEVYANWDRILQAVDRLGQRLQRPVTLLAALVPGLQPERLVQPLQGWQAIAPHTYSQSHPQSPTTLILMPGQFAEVAQRSVLALAMAGTATEQFVGLGKPAITMPGEGPQFTPAFAEAQTRLLGASVRLTEHPTQVAEQIQYLLERPELWREIAANGRCRMGAPGAAKRIATYLIQQLEGAVNGRR